MHHKCTTKRTVAVHLKDSHNNNNKENIDEERFKTYERKFQHKYTRKNNKITRKFKNNNKARNKPTNNNVSGGGDGVSLASANNAPSCEDHTPAMTTRRPETTIENQEKWWCRVTSSRRSSTRRRVTDTHKRAKSTRWCVYLTFRLVEVRWRSNWHLWTHKTMGSKERWRATGY